MDPFYLKLFESILVELAAGFIKGAGRKLSKRVFGTEKERAIGRCLKNALGAFISSADVQDKDVKHLLETIFQQFFKDSDVQQELSALLESECLDRTELLTKFNEKGFDYHTLPDFNFNQAISAFEVAFIAAAIEEESLKEIIRTKQLIKQSGLQTEILNELKKIGQFTNIGNNIQVIPETEEQRSSHKTDKTRKQYLKQLVHYCQSLPLAPLGREETGEEDLTLDAVYIELDTTTIVDENAAVTKKTIKNRSNNLESNCFPEEKTRKLSVLEAAGQSDRMVLLGDPGSGKSTFVKKLCALIASAALDDQIDLPEGFSTETIPVILTLRDFVPQLSSVNLEDAGEKEIREQCKQIVREQIRKELRRLDSESFEEGLYNHLLNGTCFLVLDGLDEVPYGQRQKIRIVVNTILRCYPLKKIIMTCRINSYGGDAVFFNDTTYTISSFDDGKIRDFIFAWYNAQKNLDKIRANEVQLKSDDLIDAALSEDLLELSQNPMLLTTMAIIHQKEIGLPKEKAQLYKMAVDVLVRRWQKYKGMQLSESLSGFLKDEFRLRTVIEKLAYESHQTAKEKETADLERGKALEILEKPQYLNDLSLAKEFLDYIDQQSGLIIGRGGEIGKPVSYGFAHRTFQEYLAGSYLLGQRDEIRLYYSLAEEGDYWAVAVQLSFEELLYNRYGLKDLLNLAYGLSPEKDPENIQCQRAVLWSGNIAVLAGEQSIKEDTALPYGGIVYLKRIRNQLEKLLSGQLPPEERAHAGKNLAILGDTREEAFFTDAMQFCHVPAGDFWMGSKAYDDEKPEHLNNCIDYDFWISRYPVTVAQFKEYANAVDFKDEDKNVLKGAANHPVVNVSWDEAMAFCAWLTDKWHDQGILPDHWHVTLPGEAEWEKAARGGVRIPSGELVCESDAIQEKNPMNLVRNPMPKRKFPWGESMDSHCGNYNETGIGNTSTVGCFPEGKSPYGCEEMSGNVWEWTRSLYKPYPYDPVDGREDLKDSAIRVLRGGSFYVNPDGLRCSNRDRSYPDYRGVSIGFRVVRVLRS